MTRFLHSHKGSYIKGVFSNPFFDTLRFSYIYFIIAVFHTYTECPTEDSIIFKLNDTETEINRRMTEVIHFFLKS